MKRLTFIVPLILGFLIMNNSASGQTEAPASPAPAIEFAKPIYDYGLANWGEPVKLEYVFTNTGNTLLIVSNVQPSCGCTTAGTWTREVEPQKTGIIPIQFNNSSYQGPVTKIIKVTTNDPKQPVVDLQLKVNVWRAITVSPQNAIFNLAPDLTSNATRTVTIHNNTDQPVTLAAPELDNPSFKAQIITNEPGKDFQLVVTALPPFAIGRIRSQITIRTSSSNAPTLGIMALTIVPKWITVTPAQVTVSAIATGPYQTSTLTIQNSGEAPLTLEPTIKYTAGTGSDLIGIDLKEPVPGHQFTVTLIFPKGFEIATNTALELNLKTSNPTLGTITVPIKKATTP